MSSLDKRRNSPFTQHHFFAVGAPVSTQRFVRWDAPGKDLLRKHGRGCIFGAISSKQALHCGMLVATGPKLGLALREA